MACSVTLESISHSMFWLLMTTLRGISSPAHITNFLCKIGCKRMSPAVVTHCLGYHVHILSHILHCIMFEETISFLLSSGDYSLFDVYQRLLSAVLALPPMHAHIDRRVSSRTDKVEYVIVNESIGPGRSEGLTLIVRDNKACNATVL